MIRSILASLLLLAALPAQLPNQLLHGTGTSWPCLGTPSYDATIWVLDSAIVPEFAVSYHGMAAYSTSDSAILVGAIVHSLHLASCQPIPDVCGTQKLITSLASPNFLFVEVVIDDTAWSVGGGLYEYSVGWQMQWDFPIAVPPGPTGLTWYSQWAWTFAGNGCWNVSDQYAAFGVF